jgi:hypothetical protein
VTAPQWAPVAEETEDLLTLVRDEGHASADYEWRAWLAAVRTVAAPDGRVDPNRLRREVRGVVAPRRLGAFTNRALAAGLLVWRGEWTVSDDHEGRNGGKPCRQYVYVSEASA